MQFDFSADEAGALGHFVASLVERGIIFESRTIVGGWRITLTGGF